MEVHEALEQLEQQGHCVQFRPILDGDRLLYHVDGKPLTEDQVLKWINDGVRPNSSASASGTTIQVALSKLSALGHIVEQRADPLGWLLKQAMKSYERLRNTGPGRAGRGHVCGHTKTRDVMFDHEEILSQCGLEHVPAGSTRMLVGCDK